MSTSEVVVERESAPEFPGFPGFPGAGSGSAGDLLNDCRRIAGRWAAVPLTEVAGPAPLSLLHGTTVPAASAHAVAGMSEYGS